jgi:hypothetical protein
VSLHCDAAAALVQEKAMDWAQKFRCLQVQVTEVTGKKVLNIDVQGTERLGENSCLPRFMLLKHE